MAVITRLASQFAALGGQAGGQTGPLPGGGAAKALCEGIVIAMPMTRTPQNRKNIAIPLIMPLIIAQT
jgi:hypothetical protein